MGGEQSVQQVKNVVEKRVLNVVSNTLIEKQTVVNQESSGSQIISHVKVQMAPIGPGGSRQTSPPAVSILSLRHQARIL